MPMSLSDFYIKRMSVKRGLNGLLALNVLTYVNTLSTYAAMWDVF